MDIELTLCKQCASVYYELNRDIKRKDYAQTIKEPCDICRGMGFDYVIKDEH